jgi:cell division protein FtsN
MEHQFSFSTKRLFLLFLGLFASAVLTFFCGVATGIGLGTPGEQAPAAPLNGMSVPKGNPVSFLARLQTALKIKPPVPPAGAALAAQGKALGTKAVMAKALAQSTAPASPTKAPAANPATAPGTTSATAAPAPAALLLPAGAQAAPAALLAANAVPATPNPADQPYVLQVGAFREQKSAKQLQDELSKKGFATVIYNMVDEDQRTWHMVRFGGYKDMDTASQAASDFTGKAGIQAFVRRSDSL